MVPRNSGSSPGSEAGFVRFSPIRAMLFARLAYAPRSECTVRGCCKGNVSGAPFPFTPAVNVGSMRLGNAFRQRRMLI